MFAYFENADRIVDNCFLLKFIVSCAQGIIHSMSEGKVGQWGRGFGNGCTNVHNVKPSEWPCIRNFRILLAHRRINSTIYVVTTFKIFKIEIVQSVSVLIRKMFATVFLDENEIFLDFLYRGSTVTSEVNCDSPFKLGYAIQN